MGSPNIGVIRSLRIQGSLCYCFSDFPLKPMRRWALEISCEE